MHLIDAIRLFDSANAGEISESARQWYYYEKEGRHCGKLRPLILYFGEEYPLGDVTIYNLREWRKELGQNKTMFSDHPQRPATCRRYSAYTLRNYIKAAKRLFSWLVQEGLLVQDPALRLKPPDPPDRLPRDIELEHVQRILAMAEVMAKRDWAYYQLHQATKLSQNILTNLLVEEVNLKEATLTTLVTVLSGRKKERRELLRSFPLPPEVCQAVAEYLVVRPALKPKSKQLFAGREGAFREMYRNGIVFGVRNLAFIHFLASTAARISGVAGVTLQRLNLADETAVVLEKGKGGGGSGRVVFLSPEAVKALAHWLSIRPVTDSEVVFITTTGQEFKNVTNFNKIVEGLARAAGIEGRTNPHAWRHGWAMNALRNGADLKTIGDILGHSDIKVTANYYLKWYKPELQARHRRFSWNPRSDNPPTP